MDQAWIGLTDQKGYSVQKMAFVWSDDSASTYFNWNDGEPTDSEEQCGRLYGSEIGGTLAGKWNNDLCTKRAAFICQEDPGPQVDHCPGVSDSEKGSWDFMPDCPDSFTTGISETTTLNDMCGAYCQSECGPLPKKKGVISIASPFGNSTTCVCYTELMGGKGLTRVAHGGCGMKQDSLKVSSGCSKALWSMPMTRFVDEYSVGGGFGKPDTENDAPFGSGGISAKEKDAALTFNNDADHSWDVCLGVPDRVAADHPVANPDAPCYPTYRMQDPDTCTCIDHTEGTMSGECAKLGGNGCAVGIHFTNQNKKAWTANELVNGCFPDSCTLTDIKAITQHVIDEWVPNATDVSTYRLTDIIVPDTCGGKAKSSSSGGKTGEIAGAVVGVLLVVGAAVGFFVYKKRSGTVGGLNTKFMVSARSNRGAL